MKVNFDVLSDRDLSLAKMCGVKRNSGLPARAAFIIDKHKKIRYTLVHPRL